MSILFGLGYISSFFKKVQLSSVLFLAQKVHLMVLLKGRYLLLLTLRLSLSAGYCTTKIETSALYTFLVINDLGTRSAGN